MNIWVKFNENRPMGSEDTKRTPSSRVNSLTYDLETKVAGSCALHTLSLRQTFE